MDSIIAWFNALSSQDQSIVSISAEVTFFAVLINIVFCLQRRSVRLTRAQNTQDAIARAMKTQADEQERIRKALEGLLAETKRANAAATARVPAQR